MRKVESFGSVNNGQLTISHRQKFIELIKQLGDSRVKVTVERLYKKRSTYTINEEGKEGRGQNGYYWHIVVASFIRGWSETHGEIKDSAFAHEVLKSECNFKEWINESTGEIKKVGVTTADLTTVEFEEYCQRCRDFIFEWFNIVVLLPNEQGELPLNIS